MGNQGALNRKRVKSMPTVADWAIQSQSDYDEAKVLAIEALLSELPHRNQELSISTMAYNLWQIGKESARHAGPGNRKSGTKVAQRELAKVVSCIEGLRQLLEALPLDARDALDAVVTLHDEESYCIADGELTLTTEQRQQLEFDIYFLTKVAAPFDHLLGDDQHPDVVAVARRLPTLGEVWNVVLPRFLVTLQRAEKYLAAQPTERDPPHLALQARFITHGAVDVYERITGDEAGVTSSHGKDTGPFVEFLGKLLKVFGIERGAGSQAREFCKRRKAKRGSRMKN